MKDIMDYLNAEKLICREERQYALFLYNIFLKLIGRSDFKDYTKEEKNLLEKCFGNSEVSIIHVAYEATYMRDYFEEERQINLVKMQKEQNRHNLKYNNEVFAFCYPKSHPDCEELFNYKLMKFIEDKYSNNQDKQDEQDEHDKTKVKVSWPKDENGEVCKEYCYYPNINYGHINNYKYTEGDSYKSRLLKAKIELNKSNKENDENTISYFEIAGAMMQAKPDIAVLYRYKNSEKYHLKFLECKYLSAESNDGDKKQVERQNEICEFLCNNILKYDNKNITPKTGCIIQFYDKNNEEQVKEKNKAEECKDGESKKVWIEIQKLLELEYPEIRGLC